MTFLNWRPPPAVSCSSLRTASEPPVLRRGGGDVSLLSRSAPAERGGETLAA